MIVHENYQFVTLPNPFVVVRVLFSLGEGAGVPNYTRAVTNWVAPQERGLALGLVLSGNSFGLALTPPLVAWIMVG